MAWLKPMKYRKGYITNDKVRLLKEYYINKAKYCKYDSYIKKNMLKALLIETLWVSGRRISEIVGNVKELKRCPGLRPMDFDFKDNMVRWHILKKNPVSLYINKHSKKKKKEDMIKQQLHDKPSYESYLPMPADYMQTMKYWLDKFKVNQIERIFPYHRVYVARTILPEASGYYNLMLGSKKERKVNGERTVVDAPIHAHAFRHGFSINFLKANDKNPAALKVLKDLLEHSSIIITETYMQFDDAYRKELLEKAYNKSRSSNEIVEDKE